MKERLQYMGESFNHRRSDVRNLSRYIASLEALLERYRALAAHVSLSTPADRAEIRTLLKKTRKVLGPAPERQPALTSMDDQEEGAIPGTDTQVRAPG